ncbi:MAG: hypothetical protein KY445_17250 [Armatimonadetes bacterium]|nr:hypothetical protein [Armatimonadota bacterium]
MTRRFPSLFATGAILFFLWAPLVQLGARAAVLGAQNPSLWHESLFFSASRAVWVGTLELCIGAAMVATILGVPVGFCLARGPKIARVVAAIGCALPLGVPPVIVAAPFVSARGVVDFPLPYAVMTLALSFYPLVALATGAAIASLPRGEEEAALLVSSAPRAWFGVLGRRIWPAIAGGAGAVAALCAWEMGAPDLLGQPSFGMSVYRALNAPQVLAPGEGVARAALSGAPVPLLALLFLLPSLRALRSFSGDTQGSPALVSKFSWFSVGVAGLILGLSPGWILWELLTSLESPAATWNAIAANDDALVNTLLSATFSAAILTFGALFLLISWRQWPAKGRAWALAATLLPGLVAPIVVGVALIEWWNRALFAPLYDSSLGMVVIGHAARFFPLALALLWAPVARLNPDLGFAAQNLGASPLRVLFSTEIPQLKPALAATFAVVWALCAGELSVTVLVHGPGGDTLPLPIFNLLHAGLAADVAALCLLLMALCGAAMGLAFVVVRKWR